MTTDIEKSFKAKLRVIAKEKNRDPADLWQTLTLERFLARLARSKYRDQIVFEHRKTDLILPIYFQEDEIIRMQNFWGEYLKNLRTENIETLPPSFLDLLTKINHWLEVNTRLSNDVK